MIIHLLIEMGLNTPQFCSVGFFIFSVALLRVQYVLDYKMVKTLQMQ